MSDRRTETLGSSEVAEGTAVSLLTGGADRPYVLGLAPALISEGTVLELIGSDELDSPEFHDKPGVKFLNLRGSQRPDTSWIRKVSRVLKYYTRLIGYAAAAEPKIFHILWNNKFESLDRTLLLLYYKVLGKKIALTVHNVNAGVRDSNDMPWNRLTLRIQYWLADQLFVHTEKMKSELIEDFGVRAARITVIPFGINNSVPNTRLTRNDARHRLGISEDAKAILFFGNITPYKGLEYLVTAFRQIFDRRGDYRLIIAGKPDNCEKYWAAIQKSIREDVGAGRVLIRAEFIPDPEAEIYFKSADVLVLPYRYVYQSGVLFTAYNFGLPVLAADVGSLRDDIVEGKTGFVVKPEDPAELAKAIERYFASDLYRDLESHRREIREYTQERHSWKVVAKATMSVYAGLLHMTDGGRTAPSTVPIS
jgi:D-inositol-3-phosphate glycosyltransferase